MQFSDDCRSHALVLMEIANVSPKFKEQALALAETSLTLANIHNREKNKPTRFSRNALKLRIEEGTTRTRAKRAFNAIGCGLILASGWPLV
jgi:hypothetical protein